MSEVCGHGDYEFGGRLEYCVVEAANPNGAVAVVIDMAEELVYGANQATDDGFKSSAVTGLTTVTRAFSYTPGQRHSGVTQVPAGAGLKIQHRRFRENAVREIYDIESSWSLRGASTVHHTLTTNYCIEVYPAGQTNTTVEAPDIITGGRETRLATGYDLEWLFDEMSVLYGIRAAEQTDK